MSLADFQQFVTDGMTAALDLTDAAVDLLSRYNPTSHMLGSTGPAEQRQAERDLIDILFNEVSVSLASGSGIQTIDY
jgi:hypothetical protein